MHLPAGMAAAPGPIKLYPYKHGIGSAIADPKIEKMIMAILGHTTLAEAERYTEEADQESLADDAVIKLEGHKANRIAGNPGCIPNPPRLQSYRYFPQTGETSKAVVAAEPSQISRADDVRWSETLPNFGANKERSLLPDLLPNSVARGGTTADDGPVIAQKPRHNGT